MLFAAAVVVKSAVAAATLAASSAGIYTVQSGDTLSGIASSHGESLSQIEANNPQFSGNWNLIFTGQKVNLGGTGVVAPASSGTSSSAPADHEPDGDSDDPAPAQQSAPVQHYSSPSHTSYTPSSSYSSSSLSDVPGVPSSFAACVAERESSNGTNQAYNGGVYGIIRASGINVNGQSLAAQKAAFSQLYAQYGTSPWAPSDGC